MLGGVPTSTAPDDSDPELFSERVSGPLGLRERKKLKAMRHIQEVALDLFDRHGYAAVTIERIATEAEVSPSSVYRYFGTKEQLVLYDEYDPMILRMLEDDFPDSDPLDAMRQTIAILTHEILPKDEDLIRLRMRFVFGEPSVRAGMTRQIEELDGMIRQVLARRAGKSPDELDVKVVSRALLAGFVAALEHWYEQDYAESMEQLLDRTFATLTGGLRLT